MPPGAGLPSALAGVVITSCIAGPGHATLFLMISSRAALGVIPEINAQAGQRVLLAGVWAGSCAALAGMVLNRVARRRNLEARMVWRADD